MTACDPLTLKEFSDFLQPMKISAGDKLAVAVSGGADSLALTLLLGEWGRQHSVSITALTVDHGLRPAAADEARQVGIWLKKEADIPHVILHWQGDKPQSNIQDQARAARYQLMGQWCQQNGTTRLFLAHHQDDQAETFLIRLFRGSGVDGLSAMKAQSAFPRRLSGSGQQNITLCRPLLSVPKARLKATLGEKGQVWIEDPSNQNESYTRVKVRNFLKNSDIEGVQSERLAQTAQRMGRVQNLLQSLTHELQERCVTAYPEGYYRIQLPPFLEGHEEISLRLLAHLVRRVSGGDYVPRLSRLEALYERLKEGDFKGQTLGGSLISPLGKGGITLSRESAAIKEVGVLQPQQTVLWDGRFRLKSDIHSGVIKRLALSEWQAACGDYPELKKIKMAKIIRETLPCMIVENGEVILPDFIPGFEKSGFSAIFEQ